MPRRGQQAAIPSDFTRIRYETPAAGVARVVLARADKHNAQDRRMLYELDRAFRIAVADTDVRVIVLAADGQNFSAGHDLTDDEDIDHYDTATLNGGFHDEGVAGMMHREEEIYLGFCWRWRNLPKPTIVQVQGKAIAGGLMLIWPFDLVVASDDATFADPVCALGVNGHEYFAHAWELGARKAKEMLFLGAELTAEEARERGMVNRVVPRDRLSQVTLEMAAKITERPAFALELAKLAVNQGVDAQGLWTALRSAFALHQLGHANCRVRHGIPIEPTGPELIRREIKDAAARRATREPR
ncbi:MAG TPA: enoyl-CoA hydratase [Nevskiaceae bacterium]|nr:enoyl-CoA hydratase [Nevskiaceae bacterium]